MPLESSCRSERALSLFAPYSTLIILLELKQLLEYSN
jgi:hypothetical protein